MLLRTVLAFVTCAALALAIACGSGESSTKATPSSATSPPQRGGGGTDTNATPSTARPTAGRTTPAPTSAASERGQDPIFWRTEDAFASLQAGKAYKVLFRITNGYAEPSLTVTATCQSCAAPSERQPIEFVGQRTEPFGNEAPGSYYPISIELPYAGQWEIAAVAGSDTARIPVNAQAGQSSG